MNSSIWIKNIYSIIKEISDKEFQERVWIKGLGPEVSSYTETMSRLYDDFKFDFFLESNLGFSVLLRNQLKDLNTKLNNYVDKDSDKEILEDQNWLEITECAKKIVSMFLSEKLVVD